MLEILILIIVSINTVFSVYEFIISFKKHRSINNRKPDSGGIDLRMFADLFKSKPIEQEQAEDKAEEKAMEALQAMLNYNPYARNE